MGLRHVLPCCADHSSPLPLPSSVGLLESKRKNSALLYQIPLCFYLTAEIAEPEYFKIFAQLATKRECFFEGGGMTHLFSSQIKHLQLMMKHQDTLKPC